MARALDEVTVVEGVSLGVNADGVWVIASDLVGLPLRWSDNDKVAVRLSVSLRWWRRDVDNDEVAVSVFSK